MDIRDWNPVSYSYEKFTLKSNHTGTSSELEILKKDNNKIKDYISPVTTKYSVVFCCAPTEAGIQYSTTLCYKPSKAAARNKRLHNEGNRIRPCIFKSYVLQWWWWWLIFEDVSPPRHNQGIPLTGTVGSTACQNLPIIVYPHSHFFVYCLEIQGNNSLKIMWAKIPMF